jgi:hypothetical protein
MKTKIIFYNKNKQKHLQQKKNINKHKTTQKIFFIQRYKTYQGEHDRKDTNRKQLKHKSNRSKTTKSKKLAATKRRNRNKEKTTIKTAPKLSSN